MGTQQHSDTVPGRWKQLTVQDGNCGHAKALTSITRRTTRCSSACKPLPCWFCSLSIFFVLQVIKVYNVETEAVVYSAQVPLQEPIKKLCW